jgi:hypothetical protein
MKPLYNNKIIGVCYIHSTKRWRSYINERHIGTFNTRIEAINARLTVEEIFKNIISKLEIDSFWFMRDREGIHIQVITDTCETLSIKTGISYTNTKSKSIGDAR